MRENEFFTKSIEMMLIHETIQKKEITNYLIKKYKQVYCFIYFILFIYLLI